MTKEALLEKNMDPSAVARVPTQARAKERFEKIVKEAEALLAEEGLSGFSIPALAERLEMTRGIVYSYFPTPYALLNELLKRYIAELESLFFVRAKELSSLSLDDAISTVVSISVSYHNSNPVARLLILGGAVTDSSYRAQETFVKRLGDLGRTLWAGNLNLPDSPDVPTLAADIGLACFRRSFFAHGKVTPEYEQAAVRAMQSFIRNYL